MVTFMTMPFKIAFSTFTCIKGGADKVSKSIRLTSSKAKGKAAPIEPETLISERLKVAGIKRRLAGAPAIESIVEKKTPFP